MYEPRHCAAPYTNLANDESNLESRMRRNWCYIATAVGGRLWAGSHCQVFIFLWIIVGLLSSPYKINPTKEKKIIICLWFKVSLKSNKNSLQLKFSAVKFPTNIYQQQSAQADFLNKTHEPTTQYVNRSFRPLEPGGRDLSEGELVQFGLVWPGMTQFDPVLEWVLLLPNRCKLSTCSTELNPLFLKPLLDCATSTSLWLFYYLIPLQVSYPPFPCLTSHSVSAAAPSVFPPFFNAGVSDF